MRDAKAVIRFARDIALCLALGAASRKRSAPSFLGEHQELAVTRGEGDATPIPKKIWMFWHDVEPPPMVEAAVRRVRALNPDHVVTLLNKDTLTQFIDAPYMGRPDIGMAAKSDLIRLDLLQAHGGVWVDATCIFFENLDWVHEAKARQAADLIAYYRDRSTTNFARPVIESWFLAAAPQNGFITAWRKELGQIESLGFDGYFKAVSARADYEDIKQKIDLPSYLLIYLAEQIVMKDRPEFTFFLRRSESSAFLYHDTLRWDYRRIASTLCFMKTPSTPPPVVKLVKGDRTFIPLFIRHKLARRDSIIGGLVGSQAPAA